MKKRNVIFIILFSVILFSCEKLSNALSELSKSKIEITKYEFYESSFGGYRNKMKIWVKNNNNSDIKRLIIQVHLKQGNTIKEQVSFIYDGNGVISYIAPNAEVIIGDQSLYGEEGGFIKQLSLAEAQNCTVSYVVDLYTIKENGQWITYYTNK